ncbi:hypothetical protein YC2023_087412 [Brassica napus]
MAIEGSYYFVGRDIAFGCLPKEESSSEDVWADNKVYSLRVVLLSDYEYKPVGSHTHDGEQQFKDGSQAEGPPRYREKGQGQQRHGGHQQQRGSAGRNTGHGLTDERN